VSLTEGRRLEERGKVGTIVTVQNWGNGDQRAKDDGSAVVCNGECSYQLAAEKILSGEYPPLEKMSR
jgi:hypothetical protein